jgi:hypothetical protein
MNKLDDFMEKNRGEFDLIEPRAELWDKIDARLSRENKGRSFSIWWKAAAVVVVFGFSFWAQRQKDEEPTEVAYNSFHESKVSVHETVEPEQTPAFTKHLQKEMPELAETEGYYSRKVNTTMKELKVYLVKYPDVDANMKKDLAELDSVYLSLKRDLGDNVAHEEIIDAMIQNFRMKLQILEEIKATLEQNAAGATNKNKSHEI